MVYCTDDVVYAKKLEESGGGGDHAGGGPGSAPGLGIQNRVNVRLIVEQATVPVRWWTRAMGTASDATIAMELSCDAALMTIAIAGAQDPIRMAWAMQRGGDRRAGSLSGGSDGQAAVC